mmetsp:Transcript_63670/g.179212  ORF Transcript_63670/g.179212 Transcript_63670/m.179212 type:complete len:203 (-) Transcript_63670:255-863(-)
MLKRSTSTSRSKLMQYLYSRKCLKKVVDTKSVSSRTSESWNMRRHPGVSMACMRISLSNSLKHAAAEHISCGFAAGFPPRSSVICNIWSMIARKTAAWTVLRHSDLACARLKMWKSVTISRWAGAGNTCSSPRDSSSSLACLSKSPCAAQNSSTLFPRRGSWMPVLSMPMRSSGAGSAEMHLKGTVWASPTPSNWTVTVSTR